MTVVVPNYATPSIISKRINQKFYTQSPLIKTVSRDYKQMFNNNSITTVGTVIQVPLDNRFTLQRGNTVVSEAIKDRTVPMTIQEPYRTSVGYTTTAEGFLLRDMDEQTAVPMATTISAGIEQDLIRQAELYGYNFVDYTTSYNSGASGYLDNRTKFTQMATTFRNYSIPSASPWYFMMTPDDMGALADSIPGSGSLTGYFPKVNDKILTDDIHAIGRISSFDTYYSEVIYTHEAGTAAGTTGVTVLSTVSSGNAITLTGLTEGDTLVPGDRLTFTSSYRINPVTRNNITSQNFTATVLTGGAADSSGHLPITIYVGPGGINTNISDPTHNLNRPLTAGDGVQIMNSHKLNIAYHKRGLLFAPCDQPKFDVAANQTGQYRDPNSGLGFRVTKWPDPMQNENRLIVDALMAMGISPEIAYVACTNA